MTLHDYQLKMIQKLAIDIEGWKPSDLYVITGRQSGKSMLNQWYNTNLCKEIMLPLKPVSKYQPVSKYRFSRAKWYEADLWNSDHSMGEVRKWCTEQFGRQDRNPNAWSRWINHLNSTFRFRDEADYEWFVLRWGT